MESLLEEEVPHKLVFLDIDGVLNRHPQLHIDLAKAALLKGLLEATGAEIVLSSMWRLTRAHRRAVRAAFLAVGLPRPISYTPLMHHGRARAMEIMAWLRLNSHNVLQTEDIHFSEVQESAQFHAAHYTLPTLIWVSHFVVLDDLDLLAPERGDPEQLMTRHHFVRTLATHGLTEHNVAQAEALLSGSGEQPVEFLVTTAPPHCDHCGKIEARRQVRVLNKWFCDAQCETRFVY